MMLSEALSNDIPSLQAGVFMLLPHRDLSGRHLIYVEGTRLSSVEYDPDSMVCDILCVGLLVRSNNAYAKVFTTHITCCIGSGVLVFDGDCSTRRWYQLHSP